MGLLPLAGLRINKSVFSIFLLCLWYYTTVSKTLPVRQTRRTVFATSYWENFLSLFFNFSVCFRDDHICTDSYTGWLAPFVLFVSVQRSKRDTSAVFRLGFFITMFFAEIDLFLFYISLTPSLDIDRSPCLLPRTYLPYDWKTINVFNVPCQYTSVKHHRDGTSAHNNAFSPVATTSVCHCV